MAYEARAPRDYLDGRLLEAAAISDVVLKSSAFSALPGSFYSASRYLPLVLIDQAAGVFEVVWVTAHTAASTSVTAVRAREGTTARAWPADTRVICAPTLRDVLYPVATRSALPTDAHVGMRAEIADENVITEKLLSGWSTPGGWTNYTPAWTTSGTDPSLGNGVLSAEWTRVGSLVVVRVGLTFGSTTNPGPAGLGWSFSAPVQGSYVGGHTPWPIWVLGGAVMRDVSAFAYLFGTGFVESDGNGIGVISENGQVGATTPFSWASGDHLAFVAAYKAA